MTDPDKQVEVVELALSLNRPTRQVIAWSLFSELFRRHAAELDLWMNYYLEGSGLTMLSARRIGQDWSISLNEGASLWVRHGEEHDSWPHDIWLTVLREDLMAGVRQLEEALGLRKVERPAPSTAKSLVPRVIAHFLNRYAFSTLEWSVRAIHEEDSSEGLLQVAKQKRLLARVDTPVPIFAWVVTDHLEKPVAVCNPAGKAVTHGGEVMDLLEGYVRRGRNLDLLTNDVFGTR